MGYAGGIEENPDYRHMGDHTETVQVDYDPGRITYPQLLEIFWQSHDPAGRSWSRQYLRAVFYHDEHQRQLAAESKSAVELRLGGGVKSPIAPLRTFTMAEDYHQKYYLKQNAQLKSEMSRFYPRHRDLVDSTAAARLNGYAGGYGNPDQHRREIDSLGLSRQGKQALVRVMERSRQTGVLR